MDINKKLELIFIQNMVIIQVQMHTNSLLKIYIHLTEAVDPETLPYLDMQVLCVIKPAE